MAYAPAERVGAAYNAVGLHTNQQTPLRQEIQNDTLEKTINRRGLVLFYIALHCRVCGRRCVRNVARGVMKSSTILREIRLEQGMTICQLADRSGLHRNTVQRVEIGGGVSLANFESMLGVLGYEIEIMEMEK